MLISEYLAGRNSISVSTGGASPYNRDGSVHESGEAGSFAEHLKNSLGSKEVEFSNHAIRRLESRKIDSAKHIRHDNWFVLTLQSEYLWFFLLRL